MTDQDFRPQARTPRGFADRRAAEVAAEAHVVARVLETYQAWGFERLETGAFEFADALGKFLPDQDRPNAGVFSLQDDSTEWLSLRYDLTAPLARFVSEHWQHLPKPFRRCAAGTVWRNEETGPGRFREFTQCDADTVGSPHPQADAEVIAMQYAAMVHAGVPADLLQVQVSSRKLLDALLGKIGVDPADTTTKLTVLRAVDKLDRLGRDGVADLLGGGRLDPSGDFTRGAGLGLPAIGQVLAFCETLRNSRGDTLNALGDVLGDHPLALEGLADLSAIDTTLSALGVTTAQARFNPAIVRGLEYYTGAVFEAEFLGTTTDEKGNRIRFGSVGSGGRYDDLVMRFRGERVPATGCSVGVSRLMAALAAAGSAPKAADGPVVILVMDRDAMDGYFTMAAELRAAGIPAEVYLGESGMKAQMKYADRRGARVALIEGGNERTNGTVMLKDLALGAALAAGVTDNETWRKERPAQREVARSALVAEVAATLSLGAEPG
ncbi:MAG: histidine--tRNA ligase [Hyphomonadaceae bacterium]|jgi:histidyl-tRNA synthetase|nr:histidine--tRNA ligase [Hyphomonadaceae bacterium]